MKSHWLMTVMAVLFASLPLMPQSVQPPVEEIYTFLPARSLNNLFAGITIPQNPGLADNNWNSAHQDGYNSESVGLHGPVASKLRFIKQPNPYGFVPVMTCNKANQLIGVAMSSLDGKYRMIVFDEHLKILSATETSTYIPGSFGGAYFYLNHEDNAVVIGTSRVTCFPTSHVEARPDVYALEPVWKSANILELVTGSPMGNAIYTVMPFWTNTAMNYYWCVLAGNYDATPPGTLYANAYIAVLKIEPNPAATDGCTTTLIDLVPLPDQYVNNPLALDEEGAVYCVTNGVNPQGACNEGFLYSFSFDQHSGKINTRWTVPYENSGILKPGMGNVGSGTAPTVMDDGNGHKFVTICDNAYPFLNVLVINCQDGSLVSKSPVFAEMRGACEASLIGVKDRVVVANNFGHVWLTGVPQLISNEPGLTMIQLYPDDAVNPYRIFWDDQRTCTFGMTMLCRESGIIFAYTGDWSGDISATEGGMFYVSAIDSWDGRIIWRIPVGRGHPNCHHYGGIYFDRKGDLYVGTINYLVSVKNYVQTSAVDYLSADSYRYQLRQNYPNPFNPTTRIKYFLSEPNHVVLKVFSITGQEIATLVDAYQAAGETEITWTATGLPSGIYFYRLQAGDYIEIKKCLLQK